MNTLNNHSYVRSQYKTENNLQVRIQTHERYTQPKIDLPHWVIEQIPWHGTERVVDVGCGNGAYVELARQRARYYIAADLSLGMLHALPLPDLPRLNLDAQWLPLAGNTADVILANYMLFHVPDIDQAVADFARVLRPGGYLLAATNSADNMPELSQLWSDVAGRLDIPDLLAAPSASFSLENGAALLAPHFAHVVRHQLPSALVFPSAEPVIAYLSTMKDRLVPPQPAGPTWEDAAAVLHDLVQSHIAQHGHYRVSKLVGTFVARKASESS